MRQQTANNPERVPELGVLFVATMNVAIPPIATQFPDNWVAESVATFRGFPVCGFGATLTSDSAFAGGMRLTVSSLGRTMTGDAGGIGPMSDLERLLVPGCIELPACRCGKEMHLDHTLPLPTDTHIRVYRCLTCHYEMRLTVWGIDPLDQLNTLVIEPDRPVVSFEAERHPIPDTPAA